MEQVASVASRETSAELRHHRVGKGIDWFPYLMAAPAMIVLFIFSLLPTIYGMIVSLYTVQFVQLLEFVGLRNYIEMLTDPAFWASFRVSMIFTVGSVTLEVVIGLSLALLANSSLRLRGPFRVIAMLPWVASYVVIYLIFKWILNYDDGLLNGVFVQLGLPKVGWLNDPTLANISLILVDTWRGSPYAMILLLAGLQTIPAELYEAAAADGATAWRAFQSITLPLLRTPLLIVLVLMTIINFNVLVAQLVLTGGGPGRTTEPMSLRMYSEAFTYFRMGPAASIAMFIFALNLILAGAYTRLLRTDGVW